MVLGEVNLSTGSRQVVGLGQAWLDDHDSAAIWESPDQEVLTAWSNHAADKVINTHRRRTDGSWLRLPKLTDNSPVTYNNLYSVLSADGPPLLYDFYRGTGNDPEAIASADGGRTWSAVGRILRDPADDGNRPYVRYASRGDRIDLIATEAHPDEFTDQTSIYHGYIQDGIVHASTGATIGPVGTAIPVTALTKVWQASSIEDGWTTDVGYDPVTHNPIAAFSSYRSLNDHRYHIGRWNGSSWQVQEVAYAGTALYTSQKNYTGLVALDPRDGDHVVISTDANPVTGAALVSSTDGQRHHELFDGHRQGDGSYTWTPLTANSNVDNLRPVITMSNSGAWVLAWLRGRYTTYMDYDLKVVGIVQRPDGSLVSTSAAAPRRPVVLGINNPGPLSTAAVPLAGDFDSHPADDVLLYRAGDAREDLIIGDDGRHPINALQPTAKGTYKPVAGEFDGDGDTDVFWYAPGTASESVWKAKPDATFASAAAPKVDGTGYTPIAGDFDGDGDSDIFWYAPGSDADFVWTTGPNMTWTSKQVSVKGTYKPIVGDFDGDGDADIFWYAPGATNDVMWTSGPGMTWTSAVKGPVNSTFTPIAGDFDGDGDSDIFWYAPGSGTDVLWTTQPGMTWTSSTPRSVSLTYRPVAADLDGDGADDIAWYAVGTPGDFVWWGGATPFATSEGLPFNL